MGSGCVYSFICELLTPTLLLGMGNYKPAEYLLFPQLAIDFLPWIQICRGLHYKQCLRNYTTVGICKLPKILNFSHILVHLSNWAMGSFLSKQWIVHYSDVKMSAIKSPSLDCLLTSLIRRRSKKTSKLRVTGLCEGNPLVTGGFPSQRTNNAENVSIWWHHHVTHMF